MLQTDDKVNLIVPGSVSESQVCFIINAKASLSLLYKHQLIGEIL